jgi:hypothetical protein
MLAQAPGSEKYRVAVQRGRPALVHPTWLIECWKQQTLLPIDQFPVQPFAGLTLTVTGLAHGNIYYRSCRQAPRALRRC